VKRFFIAFGFFTIIIAGGCNMASTWTPDGTKIVDFGESYVPLNMWERDMYVEGDDEPVTPVALSTLNGDAQVTGHLANNMQAVQNRLQVSPGDTLDYTVSDLTTWRAAVAAIKELPRILTSDVSVSVVVGSSITLDTQATDQLVFSGFSGSGSISVQPSGGGVGTFCDVGNGTETWPIVFMANNSAPIEVGTLVDSLSSILRFTAAYEGNAIEFLKCSESVDLGYRLRVSNAVTTGASIAVEVDRCPDFTIDTVDISGGNIGVMFLNNSRAVVKNCTSTAAQAAYGIATHLNSDVTEVSNSLTTTARLTNQGGTRRYLDTTWKIATDES